MKTKRLLSVLTLAVLLPYTALAEEWQDPQTKVNYIYTVGNNEASVIESPDVSGNITILSHFSVNGTEYTVTRISDLAFVDCSGLTSLTIPSTVTRIGAYLFLGCSKLMSIIVESGNTVFDSRDNCNAIIETQFNKIKVACKNTKIPSSVSVIGPYAFLECSGLTEMTIPSNVKVIEHSAFEGCSDLTSLSIHSGVHTIEYSAFSYCSGLTELTIPSSVSFIGAHAFEGCSGLTEVNISKNVTIIDSGVFSGCSNLTSISVESGNTVYDSRDNCNAIIETKSNTLIQGCQKTIIPSSVTSINYYAFEDCTSLTSVTIPSNVKSISNLAFSGCSGLTSITVESGNTVYDSRDNCNAIIETASNTLLSGCQNTVIPPSVTSIGGYAFYGCTSLTEVTIPSTVTNIGICAFFNCRGLTSVTSLIQKPYIINPNVFELSDYSFTTATLYVPKGTKEKYEATAGWKKFTNIVEMEDDDPTNVEAITNHSENMVTERYALGGQRVSGQQRSLNIVRMSDGTTKKVMMR